MADSLFSMLWQIAPGSAGALDLLALVSRVDHADTGLKLHVGTDLFQDFRCTHFVLRLRRNLIVGMDDVNHGVSPFKVLKAGNFDALEADLPTESRTS
jgi:hypothetical protein